MTPRPGSSKTLRQRTGAATSGSNLGRQAKTPGFALTAAMDRLLRLLDDAELDGLAEAVTDKVRRRGRCPLVYASVASRSPRRTPARAARARLNGPDSAATATPGLERQILVAFEAGLRAAVIAKEFRVSRSTVQHVTIAAQRDRRKTER